MFSRTPECLDGCKKKLKIAILRLHLRARTSILIVIEASWGGNRPLVVLSFFFFCHLTGCSESVNLPQLILVAEWRINAAVWRLMDLGEAVWFTGLPPSRFHHLAFFMRTVCRAVSERDLRYVSP